MIQEMSYIDADEQNYINNIQMQQQNYQKPTQIIQLGTQIKNCAKKQVQGLESIKQLESKDIKLRFQSHKKIQVHQCKPKSKIKNISSLQTNKQAIQDSKSIQNNISSNGQLKKIYRNISQASQKPKERQKILVQQISSHNPQHWMFSNQNSPFGHEKYNKKMKVQELNTLQQRTRQSRSQNKKQKIVNNNLPKNSFKNNLIGQGNQGNIFQDIELISKQHSHNSLDRDYQRNSRGNNSIGIFKIQQKLHLPFLVNNGLKNVKCKIQTINIPHESNQIDIQKTNLYTQISIISQKSSPFMQKIVKIPIDRLKPLKPEQIKLKYQRKVKEQQKNRAKQRTLQIFQKQQEEELRKKYSHSNDIYDLEPALNIPCQVQIKGVQNQKNRELRCKKSVIKKQKLIADNKVQNIFQKHHLSYIRSQKY